MDYLTSLRNSFNDVWKGLSTGHRAILVLLAVVTLAAVSAVLYWANRTRYEMLGADLDTKKAATLVQKLNDSGISAHLAEGGSGVMVPEPKMRKARMIAAREGFTAEDNEAFKIFSDPKLGMTPFAEKVNYAQALQQDLESSIEAMKPVSYARVHLVMPEDRVFSSREKSASASVLVGTEGGESLSSAQVSGIANLVSSAVEQLEAKDVTVTDGKGNVLRGNKSEAPGAMATDQLQYRRKVEDYLAQKAESMLARALGHTNCEVRVSARLELQDKKKVTKTYDPDNRVIKNEMVESSTRRRGGSRVGGPVGAGAESSAGDNGENSGEGNATVTEEETVDTEYLVSRTSSETEKRGAKIRRLAVSVLIDSKSSGGGEGSSGPSRKKLREVVRDAVGFQESRGDSLSIVRTDLQKATPAAVPQRSESVPDYVVRYAPYGALALAGIVSLILARSLMRGLGEEKSSVPERAVEQPVLTGEERTRPQAMWRQVCQHARNDPESAGRLLEAWIHEEG